MYKLLVIIVFSTSLITMELPRVQLGSDQFDNKEKRLSYREYMALLKTKNIETLVWRCYQEKFCLLQNIGIEKFLRLKAIWTPENVNRFCQYAQWRKTPFFEYDCGQVHASVKLRGIITYDKELSIELRKSEWMALVMPDYDDLNEIKE